MANPFTVQPLGGLQSVANIQQGMQGIAQNFQADEAEEKRQALMGQAAEIMDRGNPQEIAQFSMANPEVGEAMMGGIKFKDDVTKENLKTSMQGIIAGRNPEQILQQRAEMVEARGGDASDTRRELQALQEMGPDEYRKLVQNEYAMMFGDEGLPGMSGGPNIGQYNPRDYTTESFAEFTKTNDPSVLQRYSNQQSVDIGGVPHVFDPTFGGYRPASMAGATGARGTRQPQPGGEPEQDAAPQRITADDVAKNRATIAQAEAQAKVDPGLFQQGLRRSKDGQSLEVVPGSKLARELEKDAKKADLRQEQAARSGGTAMQDLGRGIEMIDDSKFASGTAAAILPQFVNLPARRLQSMVDSIESNVSVNSLNEMRSASDTGGALGNVSDKQSALLAGLLGNLDITQEPEVLKDNMKRIQNIFMDIVHGTGQGPERNRLSFDDRGRKVDGGVSWTPDPEVVEMERENKSQGGSQQQSPTRIRLDAEGNIIQ